MSLCCDFFHILMVSRLPLPVAHREIIEREGKRKIERERGRENELLVPFKEAHQSF
jgi:hypothetical protein